jgi:hypothetical protein
MTLTLQWYCIKSIDLKMLQKHTAILSIFISFAQRSMIISKSWLKFHMELHFIWNSISNQHEQPENDIIAQISQMH